MFLLLLACVAIVGSQHVPGSGLDIEHIATLGLVTGLSPSHTATQSGCWSNPATWGGSGVPGTGADVRIPFGIEVTYDHSSDELLHTVFVEDGALMMWSATTSTRMVVDTFVVDLGGTVEIGTVWQPIPASVRHEIMFPDGPIDVNWDISLVSRGFISHGVTRIHGAERTVHLKVSVDPVVDDTSLTLQSAPVGWEVGDVIVLAGTNYDGYKWNQQVRATTHFLPEDEVLTITSIAGNVVSFTPPLVHNHTTPRADLKTSVGNLNRNVQFSSPLGTNATQRGHVMFMHTPTHDIRYAEFANLGRTDKSYLARDVSRVNVTATSNVKGRYSFHFHRHGIPSYPNQRDPAMAIGNSAYGSPGWCFVHHDSNALFDNNFAYDCYGAGFSAETGNEVGAWTRNLAIYSKGVGWGDPKNMVSLEEFDTGNSGDCYWFQSRMVRGHNNIAASCDNAYSYFHRGSLDTPEGASQMSYDSHAFMFPDALNLRTRVGPDDAPISRFIDNEAFASRTGLHVVKANTHQGHDVHSHLTNLVAWSVRTCAAITYTAHYIIEDFDCIAREPGYFVDADNGIRIANNAGDIILMRPRIANFPNAGISIRAPDEGYFFRNYVIIDPTFINVGQDYEGYNSTTETLLQGFTAVPTMELNLDNTSYHYQEGQSSIRRVFITGFKTDSIGQIEIPPVGDAGPDDYDAITSEVITRLETDGYYTDPATGRNYFVLPDFYTDRGTGEVHMIGMWIEINDNVPLGSQWFSYHSAVHAGNMSIPDTSIPVVGDDSATTDQETDVVIDLLANDSDPNGDAIKVAAIMQPNFGDVYDNRDGTVTFRPDRGFTGTTTFYYWTTDSHANFVKGYVTVTVQDTGPAAPLGSAPTSGPLDVCVAATPPVNSPVSSPANPAASTPANPAVSTPANPAVSSPVNPAVSTPANPAVSSPVNPVVSSVDDSPVNSPADSPSAVDSVPVAGATDPGCEACTEYPEPSCAPGEIVVHSGTDACGCEAEAPTCSGAAALAGSMLAILFSL